MQSDAVVASTNKTFLIIEYDSTQEQYIFRLRASNSAGSSEYSGQYQFDTSLPPSLGPTRGSVGPSDASSVVVWPIILIIILLLLCCVCCWICIIAITCVHRRKQRKSYPAEERGVSVREREREVCVSERERERGVSVSNVHYCFINNFINREEVQRWWWKVWIWFTGDLTTWFYSSDIVQDLRIHQLMKGVTSLN